MEESKIPQTLIIADADKDILIIWFALITDNLTRLKAFLELAHRINMQIRFEDRFLRQQEWW